MSYCTITVQVLLTVLTIASAEVRPPPYPGSLNCINYDCKPGTDGCKKQLYVSERPNCNIEGGVRCYGDYCLTADNGQSYCICPPFRTERSCAVEKSGRCYAGTGRLPPNGYNGQNKRYRHKTSPDHGSIYSRHFALNLDDCIKLCQWSQGLCQSVNFGQIRGQNVCELLSVKVTRGGILDTWLVNANGWRHVQVVA